MRRLAAIVAILVAASAAAQSNTIPGLGSRLSTLSVPTVFGRTGTFPNGRSGLAAGVSVCNTGTVPINWFATMNPDHPFYAFILCRQSTGRFLQISDWSFLKHGFASVNSDCNGCIQPPFGGNQLGINCGDTYGSGLNADRFNLGPPSEIDPWLLTWNPVGSYFDRGEPPVTGAAATDGVRSLTTAMTNAMDGVHHRIEVDDAQLNVAGAQFVLGGRVMTKGEIETTREDNMLAQQITAAWNGSSWSFGAVGAPMVGTVLHGWSGATLRSGTNGTDDGRVWVGAVATPLDDGFWHYEYALHNRDNSRGIAAFRLPKCPTSRVRNVGFHDVDQDPLSDWTSSISSTEIAWLATAANALEWNEVFSFWFDSDAAPIGAVVTLDQARPGAGALTFAVTDVPAPVRLANENLGGGCGAPTPSMYAFGVPPIGSIPNASFGVRTTSDPNTGLFLFFSLLANNLSLGNGCTQVIDFSTGATWGFGVTDAVGRFDVAMPVPNDPALEGLDVIWQAGIIQPGGPVLGNFAVSNGLRVRIGNSRSSCP
ncbi:MAG TPA: hypothetical protein VK348_02290 [Planctomycetota bacterium]|nr:hypothetical protein [Planctomycetota bacterium]